MHLCITGQLLFLLRCGFCKARIHFFLYIKEILEILNALVSVVYIALAGHSRSVHLPDRTGTMQVYVI
jgi:hypothetical protein